MPHRIITTDHELAAFVAFLGNLKLPITVEWVQGRDRTRDQNALQWLWATEAAHQLGDRTSDEIQREWKLRHGVPILRENFLEDLPQDLAKALLPRWRVFVRQLALSQPQLRCRCGK